MNVTCRRLAVAAVIVLAILSSPAWAEQCLTREEGQPPADSFRVDVDVPQVFRLTTAGSAALGTMPLAYIRVTRLDRPSTSPAETFVRLLEGAERATRFSFSREGAYTLQVRGAQAFGWPRFDGDGEPLPGCREQQVMVTQPEPRGDFEGVRGQWWLAYRTAVRAEIGGSVFVNRLGLAATLEGDGPRFFGDRNDPANLNPLTVAAEIRWRGARGYVGGGVRYYPDEEPDRDRLRFSVAAAEELPSFKGLPIWLVADLRLDERRRQFWRGLDFTFAVRFDMPGSRP